MDSSNLVIFTISSFALGAILLMTKNSVHPKFKRAPSPSRYKCRWFGDSCPLRH